MHTQVVEQASRVRHSLAAPHSNHSTSRHPTTDTSECWGGGVARCGTARCDPSRRATQPDSIATDHGYTTFARPQLVSLQAPLLMQVRFGGWNRESNA